MTRRLVTKHQREDIPAISVGRFFTVYLHLLGNKSPFHLGGAEPWVGLQLPAILLAQTKSDVIFYFFVGDRFLHIPSGCYLQS